MLVQKSLSFRETLISEWQAVSPHHSRSFEIKYCKSTVGIQAGLFICPLSIALNSFQSNYIKSIFRCPIPFVSTLWLDEILQSMWIEMVLCFWIIIYASIYFISFWSMQLISTWVKYAGHSQKRVQTVDFTLWRMNSDIHIISDQIFSSLEGKSWLELYEQPESLHNFYTVKVIVS